MTQHPDGAPLTLTSGTLTGVAVFTLFRGDPGQLVQWCNVHLNAGAAALYVGLDRLSAEEVAALPVHPRVHWLPWAQQDWDRYHPVAHQNVERKQVDAFRWAARRARRDGHEYLAFVDADELLVLDEPFVEVAARHPEARAFVVGVREMWYADVDRIAGPFAATLALAPAAAVTPAHTRALGWRAQYLREGVLGHADGKTVYRLPLAGGDLTVHRPRTGRLSAATVEVPPDSGVLLHYDAGSIATWNAKWSSRLLADVAPTGLGTHRLAQQQLFTHELRKDASSQAAFFGSFFTIAGDGVPVLGAAGLLRHVDLTGALTTPLDLPTDEPSPLVRVDHPVRRVDHQFALVCDRRFVKPSFATMLSVVSTIGDRGSIRFVVLGDGLEHEDVAHLRELAHTAYDVEVVVHDITADLDRDIGTEDAKRATFGRIYLIDYLPEQRTVYLDGDVLATRDFTELFTMDMGDAVLGGVSDSAALRLVANPEGVPLAQRTRLMGICPDDPLDYLNGGVLVLALEHPDFRALALEARSLVVLQGRALRQRDQDATNIAFAGRKHRLDAGYNYMTQFYVSDRCLDGDLVRRKYDAADATLIHFSGKIKPWEDPDEEFYNGLYRRMVVAAEERVGVSCDFYFSVPRSRTAGWTSQRWASELAPPPTGTVPPRTDIAVPDVDDTGIWLALTPDAFRLVRSSGLRLVLSAGDTTLADVPLDTLGPARPDLLRRVGPGVRHLPIDLGRRLEALGGVARGVEVSLVAPDVDPTEVDPHVRVLGVLDLVASSAAATPGLLRELGVDGALEAYQDGWLTGWFRSPTGHRDELVSFHLDDQLVALRPGELVHGDDPDVAPYRTFRVHAAELRALGYGRELGVRAAGTNVPLRGAPLTLPDPPRDLVHEGDGTWKVRPTEPPAQTEPPGPPASRPLAGRIAGKVRRAASAARGATRP